MGQAFDKDRQILGEAFGHTKREVFDKLMEAHAEAAEIRIRTLQSPDLPPTGGPLQVMPKYRCHKEVWALQIAAVYEATEHVTPSAGTPDGVLVLGADLVFTPIGYAPRRVSQSYVQKHQPKAGGYFVVYADGYESFSPAQAFEEGYTRI